MEGRVADVTRPDHTTLVHYTDTKDLRETCAREIQLVGDWLEFEAMVATREMHAATAH